MRCIIFLLIPLSCVPSTLTPRTLSAPGKTLLSSTLHGTRFQSAALSPALGRGPAAWDVRGAAVGTRHIRSAEASCSACDDLNTQDKNAVCQTGCCAREAAEKGR
uniref:Secreted protein n=1 Tax=Propithecus coquereli TaxID=379532 RepID=A0A2K6FA54_PROCO